MSSDPVNFNIDDRGVSYVTLNRPEVHNAFDDEVIRVLISHLQIVQNDPGTRALVLSSNGKHFSAGADLNWMKRMATLDYEDNIADAGHLATLMATLNTMKIPTLTLVQGAAYAGALGLICCSDMTIASERATFCVSEVKLGLAPAVISPYVINVIGQRAARRYFLSAEVFDVNEAARIGLVQEVVKEDELTRRAEAIVSNWLAMGPRALAQTKALIQRVSPNALDDETIRFTQELIAAIRVSAEGQEGLSAFFEKRKPDWQS
ncbi:MAG: enoyl-CoA hydratase-related protein [Pseudomonadales bacterium]